MMTLEWFKVLIIIVDQLAEMRQQLALQKSKIKSTPPIQPPKKGVTFIEDIDIKLNNRMCYHYYFFSNNMDIDNNSPSNNKLHKKMYKIRINGGDSQAKSEYNFVNFLTILFHISIGHKW